RFSSKKCRVSSVLTHHVSRFTSYASLYRLAFLAHDPLIGVAHTLALVRFGRVKAAEFSSHLSHNLPVWAFNGELRVLLDGYFDLCGNLIEHRVRVSEAHVDGVALHRGLEADALNLELLHKALADASDHVVDQCPA